jgi:hypothetical protein
LSKIFLNNGVHGPPRAVDLLFSTVAMWCTSGFLFGGSAGPGDLAEAVPRLAQLRERAGLRRLLPELEVSPNQVEELPAQVAPHEQGECSGDALQNGLGCRDQSHVSNYGDAQRRPELRRGEHAAQLRAPGLQRRIQGKRQGNVTLVLTVQARPVLEQPQAVARRASPLAETPVGARQWLARRVDTAHLRKRRDQKASLQNYTGIRVRPSKHQVGQGWTDSKATPLALALYWGRF